MCDRVDVSQSAKLKAFFTMLKDLALDYYYSNMSTETLITFDEVCFSMRNYFEDVEYRRGILSRWNNLILKSVMTSNESKSVEECLQLLIKHTRRNNVSWCEFSIWKPTSDWVEFLWFGSIWCEFYCGFVMSSQQNHAKKDICFAYNFAREKRYIE
jgi:hypothetical protein